MLSLGNYLQKAACYRANIGHKGSWFTLPCGDILPHVTIPEPKVSIHLRNTGIFAQPTIDLTPAIYKASHMPEKVPVPKKPYKYPYNHNSKKNKKISLRCTNFYEKLKEGKNKAGTVE